MRAADIGRLTTHLVFDPVKPGDTCQQVGGERRRARLVVLEDLAPEVGPAGDLLDAVAVVELVVSGITVGLEKAGECVELALRMDAAAIGREPIPGERRSGGTRSTVIRSEEHTSELQSLMRISYAVFCLKKKK